jgi:hypothetical protein
MNGDARIGRFLAQGDARQEGDAAVVGDELDNSGKRGRGEGAHRIGIQAAGGDGLVAQAVALVEQQNALGGRAASDTGALDAAVLAVARTKGSSNSGATVSGGPPGGGSVAISARSSEPSSRASSRASVRLSLIVKAVSGKLAASAGKIVGRR